MDQGNFLEENKHKQINLVQLERGEIKPIQEQVEMIQSFLDGKI